MAHLMGLAEPPDELQLAIWAKQLDKAAHELTPEDMQSAETMLQMEWLTMTEARLQSGGAKAARSIDAKTLVYMSELRKAATKKHAS